MSVVFSGNFSGRFTSTGLNTFIPLPSGVDFMYVLNETVSYAAGAGSVSEARWFLGDAQGQGTRYVKEATVGALVPGQFAANTGFFLQNNTINIPGPSTVISAITGGGGAHGSPLVLTANTNGLPVTAVAGADVPAGIVRIFRTVGNLQLQGVDFSVANVVANTSMDLIFMAGVVNTAGAGTYRVIPFNPYFYPSSRIISKIRVSPANPLWAQITMTVSHFYTVGQKVRLLVPTVNATAFGMTALNGVEATIMLINTADANTLTNTITIDVDVSSFSAFAWPLTTAGVFTPPQVIPVGENTAAALNLGQNILADATVNQGQIGMLLVAGTASPAGVAADSICWVAGKSFNGV